MRQKYKVDIDGGVIVREVSANRLANHVLKALKHINYLMTHLHFDTVGYTVRQKGEFRSHMNGLQDAITDIEDQQ